MAKRFVYMILSLLLAVLLVGCAGETSRSNPLLREPAEETPSALPYLQKIERCDQSVYEGPGYDYGFAATVGKQGSYTIVEEAEDEEGNLWGKLKSGIGWVDLTEIRSEAYASALLSANYADESLLQQGNFHHYSDEQDYRVAIAFQAYEKLHDVTLYALELSDEGYVPGSDLFTLDELTEEQPLVAELSFPGDMSRYGIRFVDEAESTYAYEISISGRNGALILEKSPAFDS